MTLTRLSILMVFLFVEAFHARAQAPPNDPNWQLDAAGSDDFTSPSINTIKWNVHNNFDHYGEPEVHTNRSTNVYIDPSISNGALILKVNKETYTCPGANLNPYDCAKQNSTGQPYSYTSGYLDTRSTFGFGYYEIRCKLPQGRGFWPAFWLHNGGCDAASQAAGTSFYNEIDIFENDGRDMTKHTSNLHAYIPGTVNPDTNNTAGCPIVSDAYQEYHLSSTDPDFSNWHTFAVDWTPNYFVWYIDGKEVRKSPNDIGITHPMHIIANLAIFPWDLPDASTPFPSLMTIDYMNRYKLKTNCSDVINLLTNTDLTNFTYSLKKQINIGNSSSSIIMNNAPKIIYRATDAITIQGDFTIPVGTEFIGITMPCQ